MTWILRDYYKGGEFLSEKVSVLKNLLSHLEYTNLYLSETYGQIRNYLKSIGHIKLKKRLSQKVYGISFFE
jgi:hypothetical protein